MVFEVGLTFTFIVGAVPLKVVPSDNVPEIVPTPLTANINTVELPLQIGAVPLIVAEGNEVPSNSSAPMSGAVPVPVYPGFPWRISVSKSSVIPLTPTAPLSSRVHFVVSICKKLGEEFTRVKKSAVISSVND